MIAASRRRGSLPDVEQLGWRSALVGELDHRRLKVPSVKLRSVQQGVAGDRVYCVDLRVRRPNAGESLTGTELHSLEHFLLAGLRRELPENFVALGVMGCQTGFYLVFLNEGRAAHLCSALESILLGILQARAVPYASVEQCGNWCNHSLECAQAVAREILARRAEWLVAA